MRLAHGRRLDPVTCMVFRFVGIFVAVLILLTVAWPVIVPVYTQLATAVARVGFHWAESPNVSVLQAKGAELWVYRIVGAGQISPFTWFDRYTFFAIIPLIALFAATPGLGWIRRLARTAMGLVLLFLAQTAFIVVSVQLSYAAVGLTTMAPLVARTLNGWQILVRVLWEATPVVLWGAFTASTWARELRTVRNEWKKHREIRAKGITALRYDAGKGWES